jgi:small GTP-binding protein
MTKEELLKRIEKAAKEKAKSFDLSDEKIASLPPEIGQLTNLKGLDLSKNQLTALPPEISQLTSLKELDLSKNQLTALPPEISQLTSLKELVFSKNQLTALPPDIGQLTNLQILNLSGNRLTSLPPEAGELTNLQDLDFTNNNLTSIPAEFGQLTNLVSLGLGGNRLTSIPAEFGQLTSLTHLYIWGNLLTSIPFDFVQLTKLQMLQLGTNHLTSLPAEFGQLTELKYLSFHHNQLTTLPTELGQLKELHTLTLNDNQLTTLPTELGQLKELHTLTLNDNQLTTLPTELGQLTRLGQLKLDANPLVLPPPEIVKKGTKAVLSYLREQLKGSEKQWVSKLLLVGQGGVGKTCLLHRLRGEEIDIKEDTTRGIEIKPVTLPHPTKAEITMRLNAWDFGGQEIYHATHQFYLTERSLFVLVWDARQGFEAGKLNYWLDTIRARAPRSPVIIAATRKDERDADLPLADLKQKFPQIVGHFSISNTTGEGIDELKQKITEVATDLPLMGEEWPTNWLNAANEIRKDDRRQIKPAELQQVMDKHGVEPKDAKVLAQWMHDLGDILYFQGKPDLKDRVILKPQWVSKHISLILDSEDVKEGLGLLKRELMEALWDDLSADMQEHFLRLMEEFDLSFRTLKNPDISIIVERLSFAPPEDYETIWYDKLNEPGCKDISMRYVFDADLLAGVPTYFIARSHRFTMEKHWRYGALFADGKDQRHLGLIKADPNKRTLELSARGPMPHSFFAVLRDGLDLTLDRFPGLPVERRIPCPGHNDSPCKFEFKFEQLEGAIQRTPPVMTIPCFESFEEVSVLEMLFGLHMSTDDMVMAELKELKSTMKEGFADTKDMITDLDELVQRRFTRQFKIEQQREETHCPNTFVLYPADRSKWLKAFAGQKMNLHLYCQHPGEWHPTEEGGEYTINQPAKWLKKAAPVIRVVANILKYAAPLAGPALNVVDPKVTDAIKNRVELMTALIDKLPVLEEGRDDKLADAAGKHEEAERLRGAPLRAVRELLDGKDPNHNWGGLRKVTTPEGDILWLCEHHAKVYSR